MIGEIRLRTLPLSIRVILTAFIGIIGFGYLAALGNLYSRYELADGRTGLSLDDLRATFQGMTAPGRGGAGEVTRPGGAEGTKRSRMLEMVEPGGKMRKRLEKGGDASVRALTTWLTRGAPQAEFEQAGQAQPEDPSARAVIERQCLRCHNAEDGERKKSPFGKDGFDADYAMVRRYAAPGTAKKGRVAAPPLDGQGAADGQSTSADPGGTYIPPQAISHLLLIAHIHMLSIPMFTLVIAMLFLGTSWPTGLRGVVAAIPMVMLCLDFACWWLARWAGPAVYVIAGAGAVYGAALGVQILSVFGSMWLGRRRIPQEL